ncbi:MAG: glycogen/starch/alpha-glucan phosphorylase [Lachnospiraceae bacterium]|jgi:starch phosphorylase|nr:glycogen/starch/alpha-glucan phosphorylase [Lachnospiraceae bacterium]MCI1397246.1 glycogen/starch/alpha-glucan phosphorylase [Lachnospiraceae bacterium]MCI1422692.1 glycogen/starch/alpha-glucan phosphorylase [Lachnospiraceae bacterium]MCI1451672.1 glycogen/starch/alpha-glucan phosphorylase [Lachnospiraceae bacterium]MDD5848619.1 glycogen/starch/alpha-glucan phosphorylase [Bacillota bacterium]
MQLRFDKDLFKRSVEYNVRTMYRREMSEATRQQVFQASAYALKDQIIDNWMRTQKAFEEKNPKTLYYLSMEFLMGRAFGNDLINLQAFAPVQEALAELGFDINEVEDEEPDPALGNGGLGRLAACFLDSLATLNYPAYGCGIRYRYGMFKQEIRDGYQVEVPDNWLENGNPFELRRPEYTQEVHFGGYVTSYQAENGRTMFRQEGYSAVKAIPYDMPVVGYGNGFVDTLRIWDAEPVESFHLDSFDKGDYQKAVEEANLARTICEVLYPCDDHIQGKELRLKQQYFFVSASVQLAIKRFMSRNQDIHDLPEKAVFQMNDTHPTLTVPELMRILLDEYGLEWDDAWSIVNRCCAYTNHTIMAEALEKWPIDLFARLLPRIYQIVEEINRRFEIQVHQKYDNTGADVNYKLSKMAIVYDGQIRMANMAIVAGFSVNGVAQLHTEILKKESLHEFYEMYPEKFNNKTNGITQRRFLAHANPLLSQWITDQIGDEWITDLPHIAELKTFVDDEKYQKEFMNIKYRNKVRLAKYIQEHNGITVDPRSIFDVQVKRLHEYKRQLLNILHVMYVYNQLKKNPNLDYPKHTFIFGAKAAAGYVNAKLTIKLINSVADVINNDPSIQDKIKVVFIEDYRVSNAEIIFAAADISEQISTASKEASGTGCMKLMLNGAVTIGTMDGANVEIAQEVGAENMFIFGLSSQEVIQYENHGGYNPMEIFNSDSNVREVLVQLVDGTYSKDNPERFRPLYNALLYGENGSPADRYFILKDFESYADAQRRIVDAYRDQRGWAKMAMLNTASAGKFSSDRTIEEYVRDIWKLEKVYPVPEEEVAPVAAQTKTTARKTAARKSKKADAQPAKGKDQQGR